MVTPTSCPKHYTVTTSVTSEDGGDSVLLDTIGIEDTNNYPGERYALIGILPDFGYTAALPNFSIGGGTPSFTTTFPHHYHQALNILNLGLVE